MAGRVGPGVAYGGSSASLVMTSGPFDTPGSWVFLPFLLPAWPSPVFPRSPSPDFEKRMALPAGDLGGERGGRRAAMATACLLLYSAFLKDLGFLICHLSPDDLPLPDAGGFQLEGNPFCRSPHNPGLLPGLPDLA